VGLFVFVALVVAWVAWGWSRVLERPHEDAAQRVLPDVVARARDMARGGHGPAPTAPTAETGGADHEVGTVRILGTAPVVPLPADAPLPRRRRRPARSMTPRAVAARRARARSRAATALGQPLPEVVPPEPAPVAVPASAARPVALPVPALSATGRRRPLSAPPARPPRSWARWGRQPSVLAAAVVVNLLVAVAVMGTDRAADPPRSVSAVHVRSSPPAHVVEPPPPAVRPLTDGPDGPVLTVPAGATVSLRATDRAWVRVQREDTGDDLIDGTLQPGARVEIPVTGPLDLRTGAVDALQVAVDGTRAELPPGPGVADVEVRPGP
jgi:hypothetical protein